MMPLYNLLLDSSLAKLQRNGRRQVSHDFTIDFQPPIRLGTGNFKAALDQLITMSYSSYNIGEAYDNIKIRWRKKTESWKTLVLPNGMYDYADINSFLQAHTGKVDPKDKDSDFIFTLYFDMRIYQVVILMHGDYELDLTQGRFAELLGYERKVLTGAENHVGETVPNITRGVVWVFFHCDLITWRVRYVPSDVLYSFSTTGLHVGYPFTKTPKRPQWHPVNKSEIYSVRIRVTDGRNNPLDLNGIDVVVNLMLKRRVRFLVQGYTMNHPSEWAKFFDETTGRYRCRNKGSGLIRDTLMVIGRAFKGTAKSVAKTAAGKKQQKQFQKKRGRKLVKLGPKRVKKNPAYTSAAPAEIREGAAGHQNET